jgi:hypothetical protein
MVSFLGIDTIEAVAIEVSRVDSFGPEEMTNIEFTQH